MAIPPRRLANFVVTCCSSSQPRLVITGLGLITPLGRGAWETLSALLAGRTLADRTHRLPVDIAGVDLVRALGCVSVAQHIACDPTVELAQRAAREAAMMAGVQLKGLPTWLGTSKGAVSKLFDSTSNIWAWGPHTELSHQLVRHTGVDLRSHAVAACASSLVSLDQARRHLLHHWDEDHALVLTSEAALVPMFIHSYRRLGVLAPLNPEQYQQRPLDQARQGFMLAEQGAAVVLKRLAPGQAPSPGQIELVDTAIACEGYDLLRTSPTMDALDYVANRLMRHRKIDMLHPHAPGTLDHDPTELTVLRRHALGHPQVYAVKGALGHGLGAAGLVSLVIACLCARIGKRPAMPWLTQPMDESLHADAPDPPTACNTHAIFAAGFAGHTAGALIQRHP